MPSVRDRDLPIASRENPHVRLAHSLLEPSGRKKNAAFLVEGWRHVEGACALVTPLAIFHTEGFGRNSAAPRALLRRLATAGVPVRLVTEPIVNFLTDTVQPQGIVAVMPLPEPGTLLGGNGTELPITVILDGISDPGNAGTLIRVAAGVGAGVIATGDTADLWGPKVVRAGAGAHFLVPIRSHVPWKEIPALLPLGSRICLTDAHATGTFWDANLDGPVAIIVSNEARGPSTEARRSATDAVRIPLLAGESLNAAVAGSLVLYEVLRQRTTASHKPGTSDRNSGASERRVVQGTRA